MHDPDQWALFCHQLLMEFDPRRSPKASAPCQCAQYLSAAAKPAVSITNHVNPKE